MAPNKNNPKRPSDKAEWLLLDNVEDAGRRKHFLGSVVPKSAQYSPFDNYSPHWDDSSLNDVVGKSEVIKRDVLRETMEKLWGSNLDHGEDPSTGEDGTMAQNGSFSEDPGVELNDVLTGRNTANTAGMQAAVTRLFNLLVRQQEVEEAVIESGKVRRNKIDNPGAKVGDILMKSSIWKEQFENLYKRSGHNKTFFLVTGVMTCDDLKVRWRRDTKTGGEAGAGVDGSAVLAASGVPPNPELAKSLNATFNFDQARSNSESVFATCKQRVIFAVRYHYLNPEFEANQGFLGRIVRAPLKEVKMESATMGDVVLGRGITSYATENRANGREADEEEEEEEDFDWFYTRPAVSPGNRSEDESDDVQGE